MAGIDKFRQNGSYNKFDESVAESIAFGRWRGKFIIFHNNSLGAEKFFGKIFRKLFSRIFVT